MAQWLLCSKARVWRGPILFHLANSAKF
ncbi:MAG: hypothetical protein FD167_4321, partial [bacterium]